MVLFFLLLRRNDYRRGVRHHSSDCGNRLTTCCRCAPHVHSSNKHKSLSTCEAIIESNVDTLISRAPRRIVQKSPLRCMGRVVSRSIVWENITWSCYRPRVSASGWCSNMILCEYSPCPLICVNNCINTVTYDRLSFLSKVAEWISYNLISYDTEIITNIAVNPTQYGKSIKYNRCWIEHPIFC